MKFQIKTLGCKVNQSESEELAYELNKRGLTEVKESAEADLIIINTCTVTSTADSKARQMVSKATREAKGKVVVTGCAVNNQDSGLNKFKDNAQFIKQEEKLELVKQFSEPRGPVAAVSRRCSAPKWQASAPSGALPPRHPSVTRSRSFLKIQDGCDHSCSYCIVPVVRGPSVSFSVETIKRRTRLLLAKDYKELVLTGVDIGAYNQNGQNLENLISDLLTLRDDFRIRLSSIEPQSITERFVSFFANEDRICAHLHLPVQSGSDRILKLMNRPYTKARFKELTDKIREKRPDIALTTDIVVGFPQETDNDFCQTKAFVKDIGFSKVHIFRYSTRPSVIAASMPNQISAEAKKERANELKELTDELSAKFKKMQVGKKAEVLVERKADKYFKGISSNYLPVYVESTLEAHGHSIPKGQLRKVEISSYKDGRLFGKIIF